MISGIRKIFSGPDKPHPDRDIILTGLPRSGTTLACKLLSDCGNTIGLNEPMDRMYFPDVPTAVKSVSDCFVSFRKSLLKNGTAPARSSGGQISDNNFATEGDRKRVVERTDVRFDKALDKDFVLIMKHCAEFSLILPELSGSYNCYAMMRNPLALLGSWNSVGIPVSRGKVAKSGKLAPEFHRALESKETLIDKQLHILHWYFGQYTRLPGDRIIRYEALMESGGKALSVISPAAESLQTGLENRNASGLYERELLLRNAEALLKSDGAAWEFYTKAEVEGLLGEIEAG